MSVLGVTGGSDPGDFNQGFRLDTLGRSEEEVAAYDELLASYASATELPLREKVVNGLFNRSLTLGALGRRGNQVAALEDLLARFGSDEEPAISHGIR